VSSKPATTPSRGSATAAPELLSSIHGGGGKLGGGGMTSTSLSPLEGAAGWFPGPRGGGGTSLDVGWTTAVDGVDPL
jgi:hypothetical protein